MLTKWSLQKSQPAFIDWVEDGVGGEFKPQYIVEKRAVTTLLRFEKEAE